MSLPGISGVRRGGDGGVSRPVVRRVSKRRGHEKLGRLALLAQLCIRGRQNINLWLK